MKFVVHDRLRNQPNCHVGRGSTVHEIQQKSLTNYQEINMDKNKRTSTYEKAKNSIYSIYLPISHTEHSM